MRPPSVHLDDPGQPRRTGFLQRWQWMSAQGDRALERGAWDAAQRHYDEALGLARFAIVLASRADDRVKEEELDRWLSMWVCSHRNLSKLHASSGRPDRAIEIIFAAYERIVECLHDARAAARVHRAFLRHLRQVLEGLADLMKRSGIPEDVAGRISARAQALALGYWNVWA